MFLWFLRYPEMEILFSVNWSAVRNTGILSNPGKPKTNNTIDLQLLNAHCPFFGLHTCKMKFVQWSTCQRTFVEKILCQSAALQNFLIPEHCLCFLFHVHVRLTSAWICSFGREHTLQSINKVKGGGTSCDFRRLFGNVFLTYDCSVKSFHCDAMTNSFSKIIQQQAFSTSPLSTQRNRK